MCLHQFGPLCTGRISGAIHADDAHNWESFWADEGRVLTCPWHGIEFDITAGTALATEEYRGRQCAVSVVEVRIIL